MSSDGSPLLSIITPVYNGSEYVEETIRSVLNCHTSVNYEYIVVNDGSTDDSLKIISRYSDYIKIINQSNVGEALSVNNGIRQARGKYCLVISADDPILTGQLLDESVNILENNLDLAATYVDWNVISQSGKILRTRQTKEFSREELIGKFNCLPGPGAVFRTDFARKIGGRSNKFRYVSDYDFWLRLCIEGDFRRIPQVLAQWREHPNSTTISQQGAKMAEERVEVISSFLGNHPIEIRIANSALAHANYYAARLALTGSGINGRRFLLRAFKCAKGWPKRANFLVVISIFLYPFSKYVYKLFSPLLSNNFRINQ
jgi:glycosyltransferase involved in cell wall biosynthesis